MKSKRLWFQIAASIAFLMGMGFYTQVSAQAVGATLSGTVTDQSGGVVPNANVAVLNTATGDTRAVSTNADGIYSAPNLIPGSYSVTVTASGFQKVVQTGLTLTVGSSQTLNLTMQVGQSTQTVEVTAEAPIVNLANAEIGALTTEAAIKELPLNGRSWSSLATLRHCWSPQSERPGWLGARSTSPHSRPAATQRSSETSTIGGGRSASSSRASR